MASLFDDLESSDSEDGDYVPDEKVSSDEEPLPISSDDENETKKTAKSRKKKGLEAGKNKTEMFQEARVDDKQRATDVYKNFLEEVEAEKNEKESGVFSLKSGSSSSPATSDLSSKNSSLETTHEEESGELFNFAGEMITVTKDGSVSNKSAENAPGNFGKSTPAVVPAKRKGLQSVLGVILNKKQRISTLEKSALDWNSFKREEGISEELEHYNKGKGGFIERKRFLERSDVRSYEVERDKRFSRVKKTY